MDRGNLFFKKVVDTNWCQCECLNTMRNELLVDNVVAFEGEVARLNKKAAKIGVPLIRINRLGTECVKRAVVVSSEGEVVREEYVPVDVVRFEVITPDVEDRKWTLCATITPVEGEKPLVEANLRGFDLTSWKDADACRCDHCNVRRFRNISYVVQNRETSAFMQLGRDCFEDYIGKDTLRAMEFASFAQIELSGDEDGMYPKSSGRGDIQAVETIKCVATAEAIAALNACGWANNRKDDYGEIIGEGTHRQAARMIRNESAYATYCDPKKTVAGLEVPKGSLRTQVDFVISHTDIYTRCAEAIVRLREMEFDASDDFACAVKNIAEYQFIPVKKASIAAYICQFLRNHDARAAFEAKKAKMQHVGTVGKRQDFKNLTCRKCVSFESAYGTTFINIFEDASGNELVWKTGSGSFNVGEVVSLKATVIEHGERNGAPQTILSRCKQIE